MRPQIPIRNHRATPLQTAFPLAKLVCEDVTLITPRLSDLTDAQDRHLVLVIQSRRGGPARIATPCLAVRLKAIEEAW